MRLRSCTCIPTLYKLQSNAPIGLIINFKLRNLESLEQKYTSMSRTIQNKFLIKLHKFEKNKQSHVVYVIQHSS